MRPLSDCVTNFLQAWLLLVLHGADMHGTKDVHRMHICSFVGLSVDLQITLNIRVSCMLVLV